MADLSVEVNINASSKSAEKFADQIAGGMQKSLSKMNMGEFMSNLEKGLKIAFKDLQKMPIGMGVGDMSKKLGISEEETSRNLKAQGFATKATEGGATPEGGGMMDALMGGITKMTGYLALVAVAMDALYVFVKPVLTLLKTVFLLLFMPLIPILKPVMILLGAMAKVLGPIMSDLSKAMDTLMGPLKEIIKAAFENIGPQIQALAIAIIDIFTSLIQAMPTILPLVIGFFKFLGDNLGVIVPIIIEALTWAGNFLVSGWTVIKSALDWVGGFFINSWDVIKGALDWIGTWLSPVWDVIKSALTEAYNGVKDSWGIIIDFLNGIGSALKVIKGILDSFNPFKGFGIGGLLGKVLGVGDAIIQPGGRVIQTDPADYIFATKNPSKMGKSVTLKPTFNFSGPINQTIDIDSLMHRASRQTEMELRQRGIV